MVDIRSFGAVPGNTSVAAALANARAVELAVQAAAAKGEAALVPRGLSFDLLPVHVTGVHGAWLHLEGNLSAHANISDWGGSKKTKFPSLITFLACEGVTITANASSPAAIVGNGYDWWWARLLNDLSYAPNLVYVQNCTDVLIDGVRTENSPRFNFYLLEVKRVEVRFVTVWTDLEGQRQGLEAAGHWDAAGRLPTFPLNTDGIDVCGQDVWVHDVEITNWDDALCVKPCRELTWGCSSNHTYENAVIHFGVGASVGSVPPSARVNCVRDILFRNITFESPTKAIYLKSNGGDVGTAVVEDVTYEHIRATGSVWYPVYLGPQQQKEPDGRGDGWWPPTNPLVSFRNITMRDVQFDDVIWPQAGVLRCNASNPCTGVVLEDMTISGWNATEWVCEHASGHATDVTPQPQCLAPTQRPGHLQVPDTTVASASTDGSRQPKPHKRL
ncbi:hypothetical protein FNF27_02927 [Cafeteria roenbergensis]|uniref:Pectate lyase superfamily protein domain-containing protein n=1 Tax=Cafeteria roenbergensis TaxID=33653 RepID=A0A5A8EFL9_CAFRO|nr:hypothetical protein FNF27_02927 [Cafeteria roenbergensis]